MAYYLLFLIILLSAQKKCQNERQRSEQRIRKKEENMHITIALKQHVGAPCQEIVGAGDRVEKGQLIARPEGLGANIHSSVAGIVTAVEPAQSIIIEEDSNQPDDFVPIPENLSPLDAIREAGVVGAGGAGFPTHVKLAGSIEGGCVIANAAECEPMLAHNIAFLEKSPETIVRGMEYLLDITGAKIGYIAIKPKHKKALIALGKATQGKKNIEIKLLPDMYPAGDERVIVRELLGHVMQPGELPSVYGALISNVESIKNCTLAIEQRRPVITKDITVSGRVNNGTQVFLDQPIGRPVGNYIDLAGGLGLGSGELVMGGPFTGKSVTMENPITKLSGGILVAMEFPKDHRKFGILECECGAGNERLTEIVAGMGGTVVANTMCKRMVEVNGRFRCDKPGECPGQAEKVLQLKREGAEAIVTGTCQD